MKEFRVCYTYDSEIKFVEIQKKQSVKPEEVKQEILHNLLQVKDLVSTEENNGRSHLRYVRVMEGECGEDE
ncbi:hypothetical protein [Bacillus sp. V5-8f]|uniref:hypothetical protein n=1 Tax=Bacillus sp. V5-8f TaxID=2053044 RepID=UPI000C786802|nr:hypothetical protein [Bacillus sp. V5-8f]PLT35805.1 hypothetical protein CUU64_00585 [Bacillus sp. V5-8f]